MTSPSLLNGAIAATRFGLGARPGEIERAAVDPRGWLLAQTEPGAASTVAGAPGSAERLTALATAARLGDETGGVGALREALTRSELLARARLGARTPAPFRERWTLFWANHFALQAGGDVEPLSGAFLREVVEPHQFGDFGDLLVAVSQHPAMLLALNQAGSVGPDSPVGQAARIGLNENLGREILELHSLGVDNGYAQADVRELSLALTGWTVADPLGPPETRGRFVIDAARHQPGERRLLGRRYPAGDRQAEGMLRDLARRPETYRHLATKLARHFVADAPDPLLAARIERALALSGGGLASAASALLEAPEAWRPVQAKLKTPYEHLISSYRAADHQPDDAHALFEQLGAMGQHPLWSPTPRGASDSAQVWATSLGLAQRAGLAQTFAAQTGGRTGLAVAEASLGPLLSDRSRRALEAADREQSVALALMTPEFLKR